MGEVVSNDMIEKTQTFLFWVVLGLVIFIL